MIKTILAAAAILAATSPVAQDSTPEQQAKKCAAEGGCIIVTRDGIIAVIQAASEIAYKQGLRSSAITFKGMI